MPYSIIKALVKHYTAQTNSSTSHRKADTEGQKKPELKVDEQPDPVSVAVKQEINEDKVEKTEVAKVGDQIEPSKR